MKKLRPRAIAALAVVAVALLGLLALAQEDKAPVVKQGNAQAFARSELIIETSSGPLRLDVEIAKTNQQRSQGLMFRTSLERNSGMIFLYDSPREISMWMKNTILSLDMLFIGEDGRIKRIVANTTPMSEATISSRGPVSAVLELSAGAAKRLAIKPGDRVGLDGLDG
jgi:uncharacterized membrane protein (UPF0127 family)